MSMAIESDQLQIQPLPIYKRPGMLPGPGAPSENMVYFFPVTWPVANSGEVSFLHNCIYIMYIYDISMGIK